MRLTTRNGHDFSGRFPLIVTIAALPARSCVLDGKAIACDERGLSVFEMIRWRRHDNAITLCAFDLLSSMARICDANQSRFAKLPSRDYWPGSPRHRIQSPFRRRRRYRLRTGLRARLRGHCVEAARLAVSIGPLAALDEDQEPGSAGSEARS